MDWTLPSQAPFRAIFLFHSRSRSQPQHGFYFNSFLSASHTLYICFVYEGRRAQPHWKSKQKKNPNTEISITFFLVISWYVISYYGHRLHLPVHRRFDCVRCGPTSNELDWIELSCLEIDKSNGVRAIHRGAVAIVFISHLMFHMAIGWDSMLVNALWWRASPAVPGLVVSWADIY